jgi:hypothetical protein
MSRSRRWIAGVIAGVTVGCFILLIAIAGYNSDIALAPRRTIPGRDATVTPGTVTVIAGPPL